MRSTQSPSPSPAPWSHFPQVRQAGEIMPSHTVLIWTLRKLIDSSTPAEGDPLGPCPGFICLVLAFYGIAMALRRKSQKRNE